jgi:hypothetical protein
MSGGKVILAVDGRVRQQSAVDANEWCLTWGELQATVAVPLTLHG